MISTFLVELLLKKYCWHNVLTQVTASSCEWGVKTRLYWGTVITAIFNNLDLVGSLGEGTLSRVIYSIQFLGMCVGADEVSGRCWSTSSLAFWETPPCITTSEVCLDLPNIWWLAMGKSLLPWDWIRRFQVGISNELGNLLLRSVDLVLELLLYTFCTCLIDDPELMF